MPDNPSSSERRKVVLQQRTIEMFGLPGDLCANPACRRHGRCQSSAPQGPDCLGRLSSEQLAFYKRMLIFVRDFDRELPLLTTRYAQHADDPFLMLVGEVVRRAQPRGHWLHGSLPFWYRYVTGKAGRPVVSLRAAIEARARYY